MMTSSNGNIFRVTGLFWGESIGHRGADDSKRHSAHYEAIVMHLATTLRLLAIKSLCWRTQDQCNREECPRGLHIALWGDKWIHISYFVWTECQFITQLCRCCVYVIVIYLIFLIGKISHSCVSTTLGFISMKDTLIFKQRFYTLSHKTLYKTPGILASARWDDACIT